MGLFDEIAKGALNGIVGAKTADFISQKLENSSNPVIYHYQNAAKEAFAKNTARLQAENPGMTELAYKATNLCAEYANHIMGDDVTNTLTNQMNAVEAEQPQTAAPIQQQVGDNSSSSASADSSFWDFE